MNEQEQGLSALDNSTKAFFLAYYEGVDFTYWKKKAVRVCQRIAKLKKDSSKSSCHLELYTDYVQLAEVAAINIFAMSTGKPLFLFTSSHEIRERIEVLLASSQVNADRYIRQYVMRNVLPDGTLAQYSDREARTIINDYIEILKMTFKDYLRDYPLLDAFKHGCRLRVAGRTSYSISLDANPDQVFSIGNFDASIDYYSKEPKSVNNDIVITRNVISFNHLTLYKRIVFVTNVLENMQLNILGVLSGKKKVRPQVLRIKDRSKFQEGTSVFHNKIPEWTLSEN